MSLGNALVAPISLFESSTPHGEGELSADGERSQLAEVIHKRSLVPAPSDPKPTRRGSWLAMTLSRLSRDPYERDMFRFIIIWRTYGGGSAEEIFEQFGLSEHEFFSRVMALTDSAAAWMLGDALVQDIRELCLMRLRAALDRGV